MKTCRFSCVTRKAYHLLRGIALLAMLGGASTAWALDCSKAMTTPEINECAAIDQKKVETKLNQTYQRVLKSLNSAEGDAETRKKLIEAQRAWVKFREADCDAVHQHHISGTIRTVMYIGCMQVRAEQRIKELNEFAAP